MSLFSSRFSHHRPGLIPIITSILLLLGAGENCAFSFRPISFTRKCWTSSSSVIRATTITTGTKMTLAWHPGGSRSSERCGMTTLSMTTIPVEKPLEMLPLLLTSTTNTWLSEADATAMNAGDRGLDATTTVLVFVAGLLPFGIATWEFWRRIAVGASFGTGSDSIVFDTSSSSSSDVNDANGQGDTGASSSSSSPNNNKKQQTIMTTIGQDNDPLRSRGRRILGRDALITAYILFAVAAGVLGLVVYAVATTPPSAY